MSYQEGKILTTEEASSAGRPLIGRRLVSVEKLDWTWFFGFEGDACIATEETWRLIESGRIVVSSIDHEQQFGLPAPVDAVQEVHTRAVGRTVDEASIAVDSGDLTVRFGGGTYLQLLQTSGGYESWRLSAEERCVVCTGGGTLSCYPEPRSA